MKISPWLETCRVEKSKKTNEILQFLKIWLYLRMYGGKYRYMFYKAAEAIALGSMQLL